MLEERQVVRDFESVLPHVNSRSKPDKQAETPFGQPISSLLTEADRELTILLRDVQRMPPIFPDSAPDVRHLSELLARAVDCAVKHRTLQAKLSNLAFTDELTGLYNRQAFLSLAHQQLQLARRTGRELLLFFIDVDDLKQINDAFGHSAGDLALVHTAAVLANTFRESDILGRLGGDEFVALAIEASSCSEEAIMTRLRERLDSMNTNKSRFPLSLSVGTVQFVPGSASSIAELMLKADRAMYEAKRRNRSDKPANVLSAFQVGKNIGWNRQPAIRKPGNRKKTNGER